MNFHKTVVVLSCMAILLIFSSCTKPKDVDWDALFDNDATSVDDGDYTNTGDSTGDNDSVDTGDSVDDGDSADTGDSVDDGDSADTGDSVDDDDSVDTGDSVDDADSVDDGDFADTGDSADDADSANTGDSVNDETQDEDVVSGEYCGDGHIDKIYSDLTKQYSNNTQTTILDKKTTTSELTLSEYAEVVSLTYSFHITHTRPVDLTVQILSPSNTIYTVCSACTATELQNRQGTITDFNDELVEGVWKLRVIDGALGDTGVIFYFRINFEMHLILGGEDCDDGNILPNDGCSPTCLFETCNHRLYAWLEFGDGWELDITIKDLTSGKDIWSGFVDESISVNQIFTVIHHHQIQLDFDVWDDEVDYDMELYDNKNTKIYEDVAWDVNPVDYTFTAECIVSEECGGDPCDDDGDNSATCTNTINGYLCNCSGGYSWNGVTCEENEISDVDVDGTIML